ncbi:MAG: FmdB family zinc ribbon protein [Solirubrobacterales bacterium]
MPIYEFHCASCGERFEALVSAGTEAERCRECGAAGAERIMSLPARPSKLVRSASGNRKQEAKNRTLHESTKRAFKEKRQRARDRAKPPGGGG